jgi:hypothetical protein
MGSQAKLKREDPCFRAREIWIYDRKWSLFYYTGRKIRELVWIAEASLLQSFLSDYLRVSHSTPSCSFPDCEQRIVHSHASSNGLGLFIRSKLNTANFEEVRVKLRFDLLEELLLGVGDHRGYFTLAAHCEALASSRQTSSTVLVFSVCAL